MKVFVTGGTGLVGSHLIERLVRRGDAVRALARSEAARQMVEGLGAAPVRGAVEDRDSWRHAGDADAIIHAAAIVTEPARWTRYEAVNVAGTRLAVEAAARAGARLVHISSVAVYGRRAVPRSGSRRVAEDAPFTPISSSDFYARSKRLAEETLWQSAAALKVSAAAIRPCVIYGERERLFMGQALSILRLGIAPLVGRGDNALAMVYVGNVADAVLRAMGRPDVRGPFNTTNDGRLTQRAFYEIIGAATGRPLRMVRLPAPAVIAAGRLWHYARRAVRPGRYPGIGAAGGRFLAQENPYTSERAERELEWCPSTPPHEALRRTVEWFLRQRRA